MGFAHDFVPESEQDLASCLADPMWRLCSGKLYMIMVKSDVGQGTSIPFIPNRAQRKLIARLWHRNLILKARQLGFTTLAAILWLDHALFNANQRCGIIAQDREAAEVIFRDKVKYAYDRLPEALRVAMPLARDSATELLFAHNNSSFRVATSMRSGTIHRLHISEFGKVCAKFPDKAAEIVTGSLPAVPLDGITIIESTAEGQEGEYYAMCQRAEALAEKGAELTVRDYRFHFYPWHDDPGYVMNPRGVIITQADHEYFDLVAEMMGCRIELDQRAWYCATRASDFADSPEKMWQEYPSTPKEAFQQSSEGVYYAKQLTDARKQKRIATVPHSPGSPVNTFWDIGSSDGTGIWFHQRIGAENRFIRYIEGWGEPYSYFVSQMQALGYVWGVHYLPHDAQHERQQGEKVASPQQMLQALAPGWTFEVVPRVGEVIHGIQLTRDQFSSYWFDETNCAAGLAHLGSYRKEWDERLGRWKDRPRHDEHSEAADALRQHGQGWKDRTAFDKPLRRNIRGIV